MTLKSALCCLLAYNSKSEGRLPRCPLRFLEPKPILNTGCNKDILCVCVCKAIQSVMMKLF